MGKPTHHPLIRTIYLYIFTLLGLALLIVGTVRFLDMGLRFFIFTKAEQEQRISRLQPPMPYSLTNKVEEVEGSEELSGEQKQAIERWLQDYESWKERQEEVDYLTVQRHRDASSNLAMILVGLPLYLYHWGIIKKETKGKEE